MNKLVFLNGAINCGKTTVGRKLSELCRNVAFVELDHLHGFVPWMPIERAVPLNIENGLAVAKNFIREGIDVVFAYPLSDEDFTFVRGLIDFPCRIECVTLYCELERNIENRGDRRLSEYEVERIEWMHANGLAKPSFSRILDTTDLGVDQVVDRLIHDLALIRRTDQEW